MAKGAAATEEELEEAKGLLAGGRSERSSMGGAASVAAAGSVNTAGKLIKEMGDRGQGRKAGGTVRALTCYGCGQLGSWAKCPRNPEKQHLANLHEDGAASRTRATATPTRARGTTCPSACVCEQLSSQPKAKGPPLASDKSAPAPGALH